MMVVVVDVLNPLWIKHVSPQHSYNYDCLPSLAWLSSTWLYSYCNDKACHNGTFSQPTTTTRIIKI